MTVFFGVQKPAHCYCYRRRDQLYESVTYLFYGGNGVSSLYSDPVLSVFGRAPMAGVSTAIAVITYIVFDQFTAAGRKGKVLKNNQSAGANIGIDEVYNCFASYVYCGIIGMATLNYGLSCMNLGAGGMQQIIMGVFVFGFYSFSAQLGNITKLFAKLTKKMVAA